MEFLTAKRIAKLEYCKSSRRCVSTLGQDPPPHPPPSGDFYIWFKFQVAMFVIDRSDSKGHVR